MEIDRYWGIARRRWWILCLGALIGSAIGLGVSWRTTPVYQASVKILVNRVQIPGISQTQESDRLFKTYGELLRSGPVLQETIQRLHLSTTPSSLAQRVGVTQTSDSLILKLTVEDTDRVRVAAIANQLAQVFIEQNQAMQTDGAEQARQQLEQELQQVRQKIDDASQRLSLLRATPVPSPDNAGETSRVQRDLSEYQDLYFGLLETQQRMEIAQAQALSSLVIAEQAEAPTTPVRPLPLQTTLLAGFAGLLLAAGLALLLEYVDDRARQPEDVRRRYRLEPLAVLPVAKRWPRASATPARLAERSNGTERRLRNPLAAHLPWRRRPLEPLSILPIRDERLAPVAVAASLHRFRDGFRALRANLGFVDSDGALIVAVTSAVRGEGKSTVAANLALAEAQAGRRVVLVDADMREPRLHQFFGLSNAYGLSTVLSRNANEAGLHVQTGPLGMHILTSGPTPPDPAGLLDSPRMAQLMRAFHAQADITILDSPSILDAPDAIVLQQHVHGLIVVIDIQHTPFKALDRALASLQPAKALGTVLNRVKQHASRRGRYGPEAHRESLPIETPESAHDAPVVLSAPPEQARGWRGSGGADS